MKLVRAGLRAPQRPAGARARTRARAQHANDRQSCCRQSVRPPPISQRAPAAHESQPATNHFPIFLPPRPGNWGEKPCRPPCWHFQPAGVHAECLSSAQARSCHSFCLPPAHARPVCSRMARAAAMNSPRRAALALGATVAYPAGRSAPAGLQRLEARRSGAERARLRPLCSLLGSSLVWIWAARRRRARPQAYRWREEPLGAIIRSLRNPFNLGLYRCARKMRPQASHFSISPRVRNIKITAILFSWLAGSGRAQVRALETRNAAIRAPKLLVAPGSSKRHLAVYIVIITSGATRLFERVFVYLRAQL